MNKIEEYKENFTNEFKDLDNTSFLIERDINGDKESFENFQTHVFCSPYIFKKFIKMVTFYRQYKEYLFPKGLEFKLFFIQSLESKNNSLSEVELFLPQYKTNPFLRNYLNIDRNNIRDKNLLHEEFLHHLSFTKKLHLFLQKLEQEKKSFNEVALEKPKEYIRFISSMLLITKSIKATLPYSVDILIKDCSKIIPGIDKLFKDFLESPKQETLHELHFEYDKYYIFSHFSEYCMDNILPEAELKQYESICTLDKNYMLLPYEVTSISGEFNGRIESIERQTKSIYKERLDYIHNNLNFK